MIQVKDDAWVTRSVMRMMFFILGVGGSGCAHEGHIREGGFRRALVY
jgi:hypothetical protein